MHNPFASPTVVGGAKVDNVSSEVCHHPCEELVDLLTEIQGLRIVTGNLLEDLDRVVRHIHAHPSSACWPFLEWIYFHDATFILIWHVQEILIELKSKVVQNVFYFKNI